MLNIRRVIISILFLFLLINQSEAMNVFYYDISFSSQVKDGYSILPNGIAKIKDKNFTIFIRPANKVLIRVEEKFLLGSSRKKDSRDLFFAENFYPEGSSLISKPNYFCVEVLLYSKSEGMAFNPKKLEIINNIGKHEIVIKYLIAEELLEVPGNDGSGNILYYTYDYAWFENTQKHNEDTFIKIPAKKLIGFVVVFNISPPSPGDSFFIDIKGIKYADDLINVADIRYDTKKTYIFRAN